MLSRIVSLLCAYKRVVVLHAAEIHRIRWAVSLPQSEVSDGCPKLFQQV